MATIVGHAGGHTTVGMKGADSSTDPSDPQQMITTDVDADPYPISEDEASNGLSESPKPETANIVLFGRDGTGKSALIVRFLTKRFIHEYDPTSEDVYAHNLHIDDQNVQLRLMDTAGQAERTVHERAEQVHWADGIIVVLSLTDRESLQEAWRIKEFIEGIQQDKPQDSPIKPIVLVANKRDLVHAREVTSREVQDLAETWRCFSFEIAATEDYEAVCEPFLCLYREIRRIRERKGLFAGCHESLEKDLVFQDVHKKYRSRLFTQ